MEMAAGGGSKRLNVTLLSMYGRSGAAASAASGEGESGRAEDRGADPAGASPTSEPPVADPQEQQGGEQRCEEGEEVRGGEKPAFATLEAVAAAAAGASRRPPSFSPCRPVAEQPQEGDDAQAQKDKDKQRRQRPAGQERWVPVPSDSQTRQHPAAKARCLSSSAHPFPLTPSTRRSLSFPNITPCPPSNVLIFQTPKLRPPSPLPSATLSLLCPLRPKDNFLIHMDI